jgi:ABC-2 type transport system ATP-binding protein
MKNFSKGMKRQAFIIFALAISPKLLLLDEAFDGLDPYMRLVFKRAISEHLSSKDMTIIISSHNLRELEDICDNLGLLYKGGILFESDIDTLKTNMFKVQISLKEDFDKETFKNFEVMNFKKTGSVGSIIIKGEMEKVKEELEKLNPIILDFLPLTLEEMFIYEMEVLGYEFNQII